MTTVAPRIGPICALPMPGAAVVSVTMRRRNEAIDWRVTGWVVPYLPPPTP